MVLTGPRGGVVVNPRLTACNSLRNAILRFEGRLRLGKLDSRDPVLTKRGKETAKQLEQLNALSNDSEGLLAPRYGAPLRRTDDELLPRFGPTPVQR